MNCEQARESLLEALAGPVDATAESALEEHLTSCESCGEEAAGLRETWRSLADLEGTEVPSDRMRVRFRAALGAYEAGIESSWRARLTRLVSRAGGALPTLSPAAQAAVGTVLLVVGMVFGWGASRVLGSAREVSGLRAEMAAMNRAVTLSLLDHQSASERLRGVSWSAAAGSDDGVLTALVDVAQHDANVNVRLAAVEALAAHIERPAVRSGLLRSLEARPEPHLQMAVSRLFVDRDAGPAPELERLLASDLLDPEVRRLLTEESGEI